MLLVSVVIPTFDRHAELQATLTSLAQQTLSPDQYEIIVVDDGSPQTGAPTVPADFPVVVRALRQDNQGATRARNAGAEASTGEVIVFVDDDITVCPPALASLWELCTTEPRTIALGTLVTPEAVRRTAFARVNGEASPRPEAPPGARAVDFAECKTGLLAVRREDFFNLGLFEDPGGGWPNWDDVDFGYRAYLRGFTLRRSTAAVGQHWDYALADISTAGRRWQRASRAAVWLFRKHPGLQSHLPMFADKTPPAWGQDALHLLVRKVARAATALPPVTWGLQQTAGLLEQRYPAPQLLRPLYRWIIGSYIFRGYQQGLKDYP
jgi:glycosyltransferase involved in cell wall biosynthesis